MLSEKSLAQAMTLETYICEETHSNVGWGGGVDICVVFLSVSR
jgi:hypothetical protein